MAEPQSSITPDFLQRRFGPLSFLGWVGVLSGVGVVYYLYTRYAADKAAAATTAATTTSSPISSTGATSGSGTTSLAGTFADTQSWLAAAVSAMVAGGLDGADAYNTGQSFINGACVSTAGYQALSSIMASIGAPPGVSSTLSVCADTPSTTTTTPSTTTTTPITSAVSNSNANAATLTSTTQAATALTIPYNASVGTPNPISAVQSGSGFMTTVPVIGKAVDPTTGQLVKQWTGQYQNIYSIPIQGLTPEQNIKTLIANGSGY